jgi:chromosome segregation ATPase
MSTDLERELDDLRDASKRIADNLLELEADTTRELLAKTKLTGTTAARWSQADSALTELWRERGLLDTLLESADKRRRRADELAALLLQPAIEISRDDVPLAQRRLLDGPERTLKCTPRELLERMSRSFGEVTKALAEIGAAWDDLLPALERTRQLAAAAQKLASDVGESGRHDLAAAVAELDALTATISSDPLGTSTPDLERIERVIAPIQTDLKAAAALKGDLQGCLSRARELSATLDRTVADAQAAYDEVAIKIAKASGAARPAAVDVSSALSNCEALAARGEWRNASGELERFSARVSGLLEAAKAQLAANRAPIQQRNELRAVLDAYKVKAARLGLLEDPQMVEIYDRAKAELYTAPTDLATAADAVRRYQQALSGGTP